MAKKKAVEKKEVKPEKMALGAKKKLSLKDHSQDHKGHSKFGKFKKGQLNEHE